MKNMRPRATLLCVVLAATVQLTLLAPAAVAAPHNRGGNGQIGIPDSRCRRQCNNAYRRCLRRYGRRYCSRQLNRCLRRCPQ